MASRPLSRPITDGMISNDKWSTPTAFKEKLNEEFKFDKFDPCPIDWNKDTHPDGLSVDWASTTFVNPPYSAAGKWIKKAYDEAQKGKTIVLLTNACTDTRWFHDYCWDPSHTEVRFLKGRLKFFRHGEDESNAKTGPRGSMVVIFRKEV